MLGNLEPHRFEIVGFAVPPVKADITWGELALFGGLKHLLEQGIIVHLVYWQFGSPFVYKSVTSLMP